MFFARIFRITEKSRFENTKLVSEDLPAKRKNRECFLPREFPIKRGIIIIIIIIIISAVSLNHNVLTVTEAF